MKWTEADERQAGEIEPGGVYAFEVIEAAEKVSQKGNPYINLKLRIFTDDGSERTAFDNIMPQIPEKMRSFCEVCGLMDEFDSRELEAFHCNRKEGFVRFGTKLYNDRPQVESYLAKNPHAANAPPTKPASVPAGPSALADDPDIPF